VGYRTDLGVREHGSAVNLAVDLFVHLVPFVAIDPAK
jgi:hypothetical protein